MLILSILSFFAGIFLLGVIAVAIAWMGFVKRTTEQHQAARSRITEEDPDATPADAIFLDEDSPLFRKQRLSSMNFWDNLLARFDFIEILKTRIAEAELDWSVGRVTLIMLLCGTVTMLLLQKILPAPGALLLAAGAAFAPYGLILRIRNKRFRKFREAFPDTLDSLARALRAGYPLAASVDIVSAEAPAPVSTELKRTSAEANLGMGWARARKPRPEGSHSGGTYVQRRRDVALADRRKLSEVIGALGENMRESMALQGEVRALSAHGKLTGMILTALPVGIAVTMLFVSPDYMLVLVNHPWGKDMIAGAIACLVLAHFVIRRLVDIQL